MKPEDIRSAVSDLTYERSELQQKERAVAQAITTLYSLCDHEFSETGYDPRGSGTTYYSCIKCGMKKTV